VITKDKLNKIEQGVKTATRLSGTDIDADKDWGGKNITNVGTLSANSLTVNSLILPDSRFIIISDLTKNANYLLKSSDEEVIGVDSNVWVRVKSLPSLPASVSGIENSVYVSYQHKASNQNPTGTQIYVNGVAVGTERSHSSTSYTTWNEVITGLKAGDSIQIYARGNYSNYTYPYVRNLRVYGVIFQSNPRPPGFW
jgi:hypothetical protein